VRRALRNQLEVLGCTLSEGEAAKIAKGAATTKQEPAKYIDDDLFGYMGTEEAAEGKKGKATKRTSVVRVSPLVALNPYLGDLDFGTNYMATKPVGIPISLRQKSIRGFIVGRVLIELDRVGSGDGFDKDLDNKEKAQRVKDLLNAIKNLWASGRQSRFLADIAPKFVAAAMLTTKNPIFLESIQVEGKLLNAGMIKETLKDYNKEIVASTIGMRQGFFEGTVEGAKTIGDAFKEMTKWVDEYYS
jgi:CRISPR-associated regulatory protein, DevR family